jgi:hypothetical protein
MTDQSTHTSSAADSRRRALAAGGSLAHEFICIKFV